MPFFSLVSAVDHVVDSVSRSVGIYASANHSVIAYVCPGYLSPILFAAAETDGTK